jgi:tetratricopeptide (TPR) repeat protein
MGSMFYYYPLSNLGLVYTFLGQSDKAEAIFQESLEWSRTKGGPLMVAIDLEHLANLAWKKKDYQKAKTYYHEAIETAYSIVNKPNCYAFMRGLAAMLFEQGKPEPACRLMGAAKARLEEMGYALEPPDAEQLDRDLAAARKRMGAEQVEALLEEGASMTWDETVAFALKV